MSPIKKFFSGNTLEQAVLQGARFFKIEPESLSYEQVERRHGFLKVRRRVVIGVDPENPRQELQEVSVAGSGEEPSQEFSAAAPGDADHVATGLAPAPVSAEPEVHLSPDPAPAGVPAAASASHEQAEDAWKSLSPTDATEAAEEALRRLFRLGGLNLSAEVSTCQDGLEVELGGPDEDSLFEDRGRLLLALQHLLSRMVRGLTGVSVPCRVDSDNFHEVRAEQLRMLAQDAAADVRREGRAQTLEPMSPDERRIVHLTLAEDPAVETESHGTGLFKRVAVRPIRSDART